MYGRGYDQQQPGGNFLPSTYQQQHHYYPPQPTSHQSNNQPLNQPINQQQINQSNPRYQQPQQPQQQQHHQHAQSLHSAHGLAQQSINHSVPNNPFVLPSYIAPHNYQADLTGMTMQSNKEAQMLEAAHSLMTSSSSTKQRAHSSKQSKAHAPPSPQQPTRRSSSKAVVPAKSPVKSSKRKRAESTKSTTKSRSKSRKNNYSSSSSDDGSSSDSSSSDAASSSSEEEPEDAYNRQHKSAHDKNPYAPHPQLPHRMDHKESDDDDDGGDSDTLANWTCPSYTEDLNSLHESFQSLMNHWKPEQKRAFERRRREIIKSQLKYNINRPDVSLIALLRRASKIHASLAPDKYKIERDLIVSLFASELPRQLTMQLFDLSAWTIQRIVTATQDGENVAGYLEKWKSKIRAISTTNPDGSVSVHYSSKTRNRTCKLTGRTMKEEKEIAHGYYSKAENVNKDIIAIYAEYLQDMTGGDKSKRAPLSRANFYQLAPDGKKRKAKPETLRLDCENCHFPIRLRVEEEEIITKISKKKKVKRLKGAPLEQMVNGTIVEDSAKPVKDNDMYETVEVVELVDGPPKKRMKVEMITRNGGIVVAAREMPASATKMNDTKKKRARTSNPRGETATKAEIVPLPLQLDQNGNPIYTKRGPGRPRKSRADANLTQQMLTMLPFLPTPVSTLTEQEKQARGHSINQQDSLSLDPDRIRGFISQLHGSSEQH